MSTSIQWNEKRCEISLAQTYVEGVDSGFFDDVKYRPNKYFHPIEEVRHEGGTCTIIYQRDLSPIDGRISLEQIRHLLEGAVDATQRLAQDQVFYLYPGSDAFVHDRRRNLRIGLINVRPKKDAERSSQEMCVDAFCQLLAAHCPEGHRKVVSYNRPILTLRHLQQVLFVPRRAPIFLTLLVLFVLAAGSYAALYQFGPPRVKQVLRGWTKKAMAMGKRMVRTGVDEWFVNSRTERRSREYAYAPMPFTLVIEPNTKDPKEAERLYRKLTDFLTEEFPATGKPKIRYQLLIPNAKQFPKAYKRWKLICDGSFGGACQPNSWLLHFPAYTGGWRPLVAAIRETLREARSKAAGRKKAQEVLTVKYKRMVGLLQVGTREVKPAPTDSPKALEKTGAPAKAPASAKDPKAAPAKQPTKSATGQVPTPPTQPRPVRRPAAPDTPKAPTLRPTVRAAAPRTTPPVTPRTPD